MVEHITFDFIYDNHFSELREMEMLQNRLQVAAQAEPYLGKYFSVYQVRNRLLGYTDGEIKEIDQQISYERNVGIIPDPNAQMMQQEQQEKNAEPDITADMQMMPGDMDLSGDPMQAMGGPPIGGGAGGGGGMGPGAGTAPM
jgi:hypothetical protein